MGEVKLPQDEDIAVLNWAQQMDQKLWDAVPRARPFMIVCAAMGRASMAYYGPAVEMYPLYMELAKRLCRLELQRRGEVSAAVDAMLDDT